MAHNSSSFSNATILGTINAITAGQIGVTIEMLTEPTWRSKVASKNPYLGRVMKHTRITNSSLGLNYSNCVTAHAERNGTDIDSVGKYIPLAPKGMHYPTDKNGNISNYRYLISDKDDNQLYLNILYRGYENVTTTYYLDGIEVTDKEILSDIKEHIRPPYSNNRQTAYGVSEDDTISVNRPKFQNIVAIRQGEIVYERGYIIESLAM